MAAESSADKRRILARDTLSTIVHATPRNSLVRISLIAFAITLGSLSVLTGCAEQKQPPVDETNPDVAAGALDADRPKDR
jgi:hypothetical protein